jgi:hypothetical protein
MFRENRRDECPAFKDDEKVEQSSVFDMEALDLN